MEKIIDVLKNKINGCKNVEIYSNECFTNIFVDFLEKKDYPYNIKRNSIYLTFRVENDSLSVVGYGHTYLSKYDTENDPKYKYCCMRSIISLLPKKFRKCKFKNNDILVEKIITYSNLVIKELIEYTGGYPYKKGIKE